MTKRRSSPATRPATHLVRWRIGADLDEGDEPYWAMYETDEAFEFVEWIWSPLSLDEILEIYG